MSDHGSRLRELYVKYCRLAPSHGVQEWDDLLGELAGLVADERDALLRASASAPPEKAQGVRAVGKLKALADSWSERYGTMIGYQEAALQLRPILKQLRAALSPSSRPAALREAANPPAPMEAITAGEIRTGLLDTFAIHKDDVFYRAAALASPREPQEGQK